MSGTAFTDIRRFPSIDSTNRYLLDEARAGAPAGIVAVADHQTAGRGRLGRRWLAPPGANLLLSVLLRPPLDPADRHLAAAAVALAAIDAVNTLLPTPDHDRLVGIKWPNDLVAADGRKVAGVLAEGDLSGGPSGSPAPVVVGIGINANWPDGGDDGPPELEGRAVSLARLSGGPVDRDALMAALLDALPTRVDALSTPDGRAGLAADLRVACVTLGVPVRVELAGEVLEGMATGLTGAGHLVVRTPAGDRTVVAGDVVHLRLAVPPRPPGDPATRD